MLISHNLKLLYFKNIGLKITDQEIQDINETFLESNEDERMNIEEAIKNIKSLRQQIKYEFVDTNR